MNVPRRAKMMEYVLETTNVTAKLVSMENYVRKVRTTIYELEQNFLVKSSSCKINIIHLS